MVMIGLGRGRLEHIGVYFRLLHSGGRDRHK